MPEQQQLLGELPPDGPGGVFLVVDVDVVVLGVLLQVANQRGVGLGAARGNAARGRGEWLDDGTRLARGSLVDMGGRGGFDALGGNYVANCIRWDHDDGSGPAAVGVARSGHFLFARKLGVQDGDGGVPMPVTMPEPSAVWASAGPARASIATSALATVSKSAIRLM